MTSQQIAAAIVDRRITRLCHFSPFKNAHHIFRSRTILCSERLKAEHPETYNPTDAQRLDRKQTHVCTTIEYPNVWYLDKSEATDDFWIDYLVFLIDPGAMTWAGVEFCKGNAARGRGLYCSPGLSALSGLFAAEVAGYAIYRRENGHPSWLPTDMQAEVLIPDVIAFDHVTGVVVRSKASAKRLLSQLKLAETTLDLPLLVSPGMFSQSVLRRLRTGGPRPNEETYP